ncbi:DUF6220 domain-containing protein [Evansella halocellulosilytica]|uniref:DUF6220 domain-containing protein n=1 Tax=Evansella halocellulosilytica TaxID=2011013 RepID=UPI000BB7750B|nr:DUF6220 domain-containing protein [Evansella halocellulosilytica]
MKYGSISQFIYIAMSFVFLLCVLFQFYTAGLSIFGGGHYWVQHKMVVHLFGINLPIFMMITAFIGRLPKIFIYYTGGFLVLIFSMYVTANLGFQLPIAGSLHPIFGTILVILALFNVYYAVLPLKKKKEAH